MFLEGGGTFRLRLWPDFIAHSILLTLRKYELLYLDVRSISLAHAVVSLFYLRIKKQSPEVGARTEYGFSSLLSPAHDIRRIYRVYKVLLRRGTSTVLLLRANNEHFENNLIDRPSILSTFDLSFKDARRGDNPPPTSPRILPSSLISRRMFHSLFHPRLSRLMQSESVLPLLSYSASAISLPSVSFPRSRSPGVERRNFRRAFPSERDRSDISRGRRQISPDNNTSLLQQFQQSRE